MNGAVISIIIGVLANFASLAILRIVREIQGRRRAPEAPALPPQLSWPRSGILLSVSAGAVTIAFLIHIVGQLALPEWLAPASPITALLIAIAGSLLWPLAGRPVVWRWRSAWLETLLQRSHLFYFSPNMTPEQLEHSHKTIRDAVSSAPSLDILVGNGYRTLRDGIAALRHDRPATWATGGQHRYCSPLPDAVERLR